jgi:hypothetical protein
MLTVVRRGIAIAIFGGIVQAGSLAAQQPADPKCKPVHADLVEDQATVGCKPEHTSCFLGLIDGNHGLRGSTYFKGDAGAAGPSTSPAFISYSGTFEYTTETGTITARETGVTSSSLGVVTAYQSIVDATGEFAGSTGHFFVSGFSHEGHIITKVMGAICYP